MVLLATARLPGHTITGRLAQAGFGKKLLCFCICLCICICVCMYTFLYSHSHVVCTYIVQGLRKTTVPLFVYLYVFTDRLGLKKKLRKALRTKA